MKILFALSCLLAAPAFAAGIQYNEQKCAEARAENRGSIYCLKPADVAVPRSNVPDDDKPYQAPNCMGCKRADAEEYMVPESDEEIQDTA